MKLGQWWENVAIRFMHPELFVDDESIREVVKPKPPSEHARANARAGAIWLEENRKHV